MTRSNVSTLTARLCLCAAVLAAALLAGCSGGDGPAAVGDTAAAEQPADASRGSLELHVVFPVVHQSATGKAARAKSRGSLPPYDGSIPFGSHSVKIVLTDPATGASLAPARIVNDTDRPDGVHPGIAVGFPLLRVGPVKVDVTSHPDLAATGSPLGTGTVTTQIAANSVATASVQMALTISKLVISPPRQRLDTSQGLSSGTVTGQALDAQGKPLLYPLQYSSDNPGIADITSVSPDFMTATVTAEQTPEGQATVTVTVTEPNSGLQATAQVVVGNFGG
jgi:hypothetical protein